MKDLIDREKALDCFHDWVDKYGDVHTADEMTEYQAIEALPTEKSQCALCQYNDLEWDEEPCESCTMGGENNHFKAVELWIPCSERLPEDGLYLVTTSKGQVQAHVFSHNGNSEEYWMRCNKAWMELPEPYKGKMNEKCR